MVKFRFCKKSLLVYYLSICLVSLGIMIHQPQIADAKIVNKSEESQNIDLRAYTPDPQDSQQLEELRAGALSAEEQTQEGNRILINLLVIMAAVLVIWLAFVADSKSKTNTK